MRKKRKIISVHNFKNKRLYIYVYVDCASCYRSMVPKNMIAAGIPELNFVSGNDVIAYIYHANKENIEYSVGFFFNVICVRYCADLTAFSSNSLRGFFKPKCIELIILND